MRYRFGRKYQYSIKDGNDFRLLIDGEEYFPRMLEAIDGARLHILMEQYLVRSGRICDRFVTALSKAAQRGVAVYLMLDDFGSARMNDSDRERLQQAGVHLHFYNPIRFQRLQQNIFRTHRKILAVDNQLAFTGGAGITDDFNYDVDGQPAWHDVMLEIAGPVVADWQDLFVRTWQHCHTKTIELNPKEPAIQAENQTGRLLEASPLRRQEINRALVHQIREAQHRIWITTPYFITSRKIRRNLRWAARKGIDVRLLTSGPYSDIPWVSSAVRRLYGGYLKSGIRIFEYQPRFSHAKIEMVDNWVSLGSSNLDRWNQHWSLDANQSVDAPVFTRNIEDYFATDFASSHEITLQDWLARSWWERLKEFLSGWRIYLLEKVIAYLHPRKPE